MWVTFKLYFKIIVNFPKKKSSLNFVCSLKLSFYVFILIFFKNVLTFYCRHFLYAILSLSIAITPSWTLDNFCFYQRSETGYFCELLSGTHLNRDDEFVILGNHVSPLTDLDVVRVVSSQDFPSNLKFLPSALLQKFPNLKNLELLNVRLETLNRLEYCEKLEKISLDHNMLARISPGIFENCSNLTEISIGSNEINELDDEAFRNLQKLQILSLKNNIIDKVIPKIFDLLPNLKSVDLQSNRINEIPSNSFNNLLKLENIHLEFNNVRKIFSEAFKNLPALIQLNLNDNQIEEIDLKAFHTLDNLDSFYLYNNSISELKSGSFSKMPKLRILRLDSNKITAVQRNFFENFPELQELRTEGNSCVNRNFSPRLEDFLEFFEDCFNNWRENETSTTESSTTETSTNPGNGTSPLTTPETTTPATGSQETALFSLLLALLFVSKIM